MTTGEYQQLVKNTPSFQEMSAQMQSSILSAQGEQMEKYIQLFQEEKKLLANSYQNFQKEVDQIVINHKTNEQKNSRTILKTVEAGDQQQQERQAESLLNNI